VEGFRKFVVYTWSSAPGDNRNDMRNLMKKLKFLKIKIREWNFGHISSSRVEIKHLQEELNRLDTEIESENRVSFDMEFPNSLSRAQQEELESDVTREEIKRAVWDCGVDKSPGPDGFTFGFYRQFWDLVEKDVISAVNYFFKHGEFSSGCNSSFI
nr:RNA-directed DNA polymerase, eukaryota, reverse transcriptase zinc-binding domain protein [Tanacetum cinerariifolium]